MNKLNRRGWLGGLCAATAGLFGTNLGSDTKKKRHDGSESEARYLVPSLFSYWLLLIRPGGHFLRTPIPDDWVKPIYTDLQLFDRYEIRPCGQLGIQEITSRVVYCTWWSDNRDVIWRESGLDLEETIRKTFGSLLQKQLPYGSHTHLILDPKEHRQWQEISEACISDMGWYNIIHPDRRLYITASVTKGEFDERRTQDHRNRNPGNAILVR